MAHPENNTQEFSAASLIQDCLVNGMTRAPKPCPPNKKELRLALHGITTAMDAIMSDIDYQQSKRSNTAVGLRLLGCMVIKLAAMVDGSVNLKKQKNTKQ